jgi:signal transduction histidine kinase
MNAKKILSRKGRRVFTITSSATPGDAVSRLTKCRVGALIVAGADGIVVGIVSERDIVRALGHKGAAALALPITKVMTNTVVTCTESSTLIWIMNKMTRGRFRHMPVVRHGDLAGLVSMGDAVKFRLTDLEDTLTNVQSIIASIAHEVRQPLAAIAANGGAALRFLERAPVDNDEVRAALNRVIADCHRTNAVFESIRALFGSGDQPMQSVSLNDIIVDVLQSLRVELEEHGVTVRSQLMAAQATLVDGHRAQLQEVITNLIHNAVEAMDATTDRDRVLNVKTEVHRQDAIRVAVEDSGPGIAQRQLNRIFSAFVSTKPSGMGLGLAICKMIVERHGGNISAISDGRSGTTMQFILPISNATSKKSLRHNALSAPRSDKYRRTVRQGTARRGVSKSKPAALTCGPVGPREPQSADA